MEPLAKATAWPADPERAHGLGKLYSEKLCQCFCEDFMRETRVVCFHNVYGAWRTHEGGRKKAPAAIDRKVALALQSDEVDGCGDGRQTRYFMQSDCPRPINLGTDELGTIKPFVDSPAAIAGKQIRRRNDVSTPQVAGGRNSDNAFLRQTLRREPSIRLFDGLETTYAWIEEELCTAGRTSATAPGQTASA